MMTSQRLDFDYFKTRLNIPPITSEHESLFAFSLHKAGSTLLYNMLRDLAPYVGLPYVSLEDQLFSEGIGYDELPINAGEIFSGTGCIYGGFRFYNSGYSIPNISERKKILLVRHPLDILVSLYFSLTKSHGLPGGGLTSAFVEKKNNALKLGAEQFALQRSMTILSLYLSYQPILADKNLVIFRYEDIIYDKVGFLREICTHFGLCPPQNVIDEIAARYDIIPANDSPDQHVRQVHPNNYRKHLSPDVIEFLTEYFSPVLQAFGYKTSGVAAHAVLEEFRKRQERLVPKTQERTAIEIVNDKLDRLIRQNERKSIMSCLRKLQW
jgi:hypothetical protein